MKKKVIILLVALVFVGIIYGIGLLESKREVHITAQLETEQLIADGKSIMKVHVSVKNADGTPRKGDELTLVRTVGYGQLKAKRIVTDSAGNASFDYYSYRGGSFTPVVDNQISITDISVGRIVGVKKKVVVEIPMVEPADSDVQDEPDQSKANDKGHIQLGGG